MQHPAKRVEHIKGIAIKVISDGWNCCLTSHVYSVHLVGKQVSALDTRQVAWTRYKTGYIHSWCLFDKTCLSPSNVFTPFFFSSCFFYTHKKTMFRCRTWPLSLLESTTSKRTSFIELKHFYYFSVILTNNFVLFENKSRCHFSMKFANQLLSRTQIASW